MVSVFSLFWFPSRLASSCLQFKQYFLHLVLFNIQKEFFLLTMSVFVMYYYLYFFSIIILYFLSLLPGFICLLSCPFVVLPSMLARFLSPDTINCGIIFFFLSFYFSLLLAQSSSVFPLATFTSFFSPSFV